MTVYFRTTPLREDNLYPKLMAKQDKKSDYEWAALLKIERSLWTNYRLRKRPMTLTILRAVARKFCEFDPDIIQFLRDGNDKE